MDSRNHVVLYLTLIALEGALLLGVRRLTRTEGVSLRDQSGPRWRSILDVARDILIGAAVWAVWIGLMRIAGHRPPPESRNTVAGMLPAGTVEAMLWIVLSISAGIAEELAFRGYLQRKLIGLSGRVSVGVVLQAVVFGLVHGYQGMWSVVRIVSYGVLFGVTALWRKSLRPGMIAHAWTDIAAGLLRW